MTISTNAEALNATALATRAIHAGQEPDPTTGAVVTPIYRPPPSSRTASAACATATTTAVPSTRPATASTSSSPPWKARNTR